MKSPSHAQIVAIANQYGLDLTEEEIAVHSDFIASFGASYETVQRLHDEVWPSHAPERSYEWPSDEDNRMGAWYVKTLISETGTDDGPLRGLRIAVKDNVSLAGVPMMMGSKLVEGFIPKSDATVVTRLLAAGASINGKTVCEDMCLSAGSHTASSGPVRNPWNPLFTSGGSSSGSAVVVALGEADGAIGGDQAGSIRVPSAHCGIVGHKPTRGRVPYTGLAVFDNTLDHVGPMARTTGTVARMLDVLSGPDGIDPKQWEVGEYEPAEFTLHDGVSGIRIGLLREGFSIPGLSDPQVDSAVREATEALRDKGATVTEVSVPMHSDAVHLVIILTVDGGTPQVIDGNGFSANSTTLYDPDFITHFGENRRLHPEWLPETVKLSLLAGRHSINEQHGRYHAMTQNLASVLRRAYDTVLDDVDVLVLPTVARTAQPLPSSDASTAEVLAVAFDGIVNTCGFDISGHPATTVPVGLVNGLPVGMMIVGRRNEDATCLRVAQAYEELIGGFPAPTNHHQ